MNSNSILTKSIVKFGERLRRRGHTAARRGSAPCDRLFFVNLCRQKCRDAWIAAQLAEYMFQCYMIGYSGQEVSV